MCPPCRACLRIYYNAKLADGDGKLIIDTFKNKHPSSFTPLQVLKGMGEAMQLMREGRYAIHAQRTCAPRVGLEE